MHLATWNVLHRIHAENWDEATLARYPDERARSQAVSNLVLDLLAAATTVLCLQEVSGDQLADLRRRLPAAIGLYVHRYSRVPRLNGSAASPLSDPSEQLVTLVVGQPAEVLRAEDSPTDPGKGFLAVRLRDGVTIVNAHVTFGTPGLAQLATLAVLAHSAAAPAILAGDFNTDAASVRRALPPPFVLTDLSGERPTRVADAKHPGRWIDHVVALGMAIESVRVIDAGLCSDHNPVCVHLAPAVG